MSFRYALAIVGAACSIQFAPASAQTSINVITYHYDNFRTGWNQHETVLTTSNVVAGQFGQVGHTALDAQVDAQPLVFNDVVYVATENNTIYAINASTGAIIKSVNLGAPVLRPGTIGSGCAQNGRTIGIGSTPVIDPTANAGAGVMYVITYTGSTAAPVYIIHELALPGLTEVTSRVVSASHLESDGKTVFNFTARYHRQRVALLEANGNVYAAFSAWCDTQGNFARGWVLGWQAGTLTPLPANELTNTQTASQQPTGVKHPAGLSSIWMSGYGIATDASGDLFFVTGNSNAVLTDNLEESAVRLSPDLRTVRDHFTPSNYAQWDATDEDFGSSGLLAIPAKTGIPNRAVAGQKHGAFYIMDRNPGMLANNPLTIQIGHCECGPSYFLGSDGVGRVVTSGLNSLRTYKNTASFPTSPEATNTIALSVQSGDFLWDRAAAMPSARRPLNLPEQRHAA
jgi:hypothetical protein